MKSYDVFEPCRHLRARAPEEWQRFVEMFQVYTAETVDAVIEADATEIMTVKGRAQACKALLQAFTNLDIRQPRAPTP
jgi:hypothetical protein